MVKVFQTMKESHTNKCFMEAIVKVVKGSI